MTKDELLAATTGLLAEISAFAQKRVVGNEIISVTGEHSGMYETIVNGEEALLGQITVTFNDLVIPLVEQLTGEPTDDEKAKIAPVPAPAPS